MARPTSTLRRLVGAFAVAACFVLVAPSLAGADVISDWNAIAQTETLLLRPTAHGQMRGIAMVEGAVYDAVNAIDRRYQPYLLEPDTVGVQPWASQDAAAATAAYLVLSEITPDARQAGLDVAYAATLSAIPNGLSKVEGIQAGAAATDAMLDSRVNDGFMASFAFDIGSGAGDWRPLGWPATPAFDPDPWVGNLRPFLIEDASAFRSKGPNPLESPTYAQEFNEVKQLGALNSPTRTEDQTKAALFWQFAPIALWNRLARDLAGEYDLDTAEQARLYASVNLAGADAAIACWNDKYHYNFWRPRAAIREADTDGNPATIADPNWEPLFHGSVVTTPGALTTPPFPDHPSGHGCLSGAALNAFAEIFGDKTAFDVVSARTLDGVAIPPRHFDRFSEALDEIVEARIWGGIHFRTADEQGTVIGEQVAKYVKKHYFRLVH